MSSPQVSQILEWQNDDGYFGTRNWGAYSGLAQNADWKSKQNRIARDLYASIGFCETDEIVGNEIGMKFDEEISNE